MIHCGGDLKCQGTGTDGGLAVAVRHEQGKLADPVGES